MHIGGADVIVTCTICGFGPHYTTRWGLYFAMIPSGAASTVSALASIPFRILLGDPHPAVSSGVAVGAAAAVAVVVIRSGRL